MWLAETAALYTQLGLPVSIMHYMYFRDRISILTRTQEYQEAIRTGREFLQLVETAEVNDPPQRRWWASDIWGRFIEIYGKIEDDEEIHVSLKSARGNLQDYEAEWQTAVGQEADEERRENLEWDYRRFNSHAFGNFGGSCSKVGLLDEAIEFTERAIQIKENGNLYMGLAITHLKKGDGSKALEVLRRLHSSADHARWVYFGGARRWFYNNESFKSVQDDPEFVELIQEGATG